MIGIPLDAADVDGFGLLDYRQDISRVPHILMPTDSALVLGIFQCSGGIWRETYFWVTEDLSSWDIVLDDPEEKPDLMAVTLPLFHHWAFEKNQKRLPLGGCRPDDSMLIDSATPLSVLEAMYNTLLSLPDYGDLLNSVPVCLPHLDELGWAYIPLQEWIFDGALLLCSASQQSNLLRVVEALTAAKQPVYRIS